MRLLIFSLSLLAGLCACTDTSRWIGTQLPPEQRTTDLARCRREAEEALGPNAATDPGPISRGDPMALVDRTRTLDQFEAIVAACMTEQGYRRSP